MALNQTVKGSVNYTVVGSPTIVDGVVSGFSSSNYLQINGIDYTTRSKFRTNFEFQIKIKFKPTTHTDYSSISYWPNRGGDCSFTVQNNNKIRFSFYNKDGVNFYIDTINAPSENDILWLKTTIKNNLGELLISSDGENWTSQGTLDLSSMPSDITTDTYARFGVDGSAIKGHNFEGDIYLNSTYIKVDSKAWFGNCSVEVKHVNYGTSVGYTKVGSPTIVNGVVSGFIQGTNYLTLPQINMSDLMNSEMCFRARTDTFPIPLVYMAQNTLTMFVNGVSGAFVVSVAGASSVNLSLPESYNRNDFFDYKVIIENGLATIYFSPINGEFVSLGTIDLSTYTGTTNKNIWIGRNDWHWTNGTEFPGSIDLNNTYIKVDGKLWFFQPCTNYVKQNDKLVFADSNLYLAGPVNYTVVGNPTIVDGVASGFSNSSYVRTASQLNSTSPFEIIIKIKTPSSLSDVSWSVCRTPQGFIMKNWANKLEYIWYDTVGSEHYLQGSTVLTSDTVYYVKVAYDGNHIYLYQSNNGQDFILENSVEASVQETQYFFALGGLYARSWPGSIDLNETYIKVNSNLWFYGKNYASQNIAPVPAGYPLGNTTTPSIGYVDMRTQTFTSAPTGATLEKDE